MVAPVDDSAADCVADESEDWRSVVDFFVDRVSEASGLDLVVDRPAPKDVLGFVPETVDVDEPLDDSEPGSVDEEEFVAPDDVLAAPDDVPVDPDDEVADPDELEDPDDELDDDCPPSSANADPIPQVPTKPATPSEKATAPTRNATLAEFISGPTPPSDRRSERASAAEPDVPEAVAALTAIPVPVVGVALGDLDVRAVHIAGFERRVGALHLYFVGVRHADTQGQQPSQRQRSRCDHSLHACTSIAASDHPALFADVNAARGD
ncbi:hypothetical protein AU198_23250 [Mycobacterium sp. GA-1199]|uniref:hypothetical protein n=1 Tax=Mycobacterium sp. GA-1199 TaxID=1772287 RepID=UPI00074987FC|nr:hypothetical protein [Mycobacterium sp. GA-1199]KUI47344.1 hypothetical protein AU198_23250 [Mycobacterium sp. GA-1199]